LKKIISKWHEKSLSLNYQDHYELGKFYLKNKFYSLAIKEFKGTLSLKQDFDPAIGQLGNV
jgi:hypothetical protein